MTVAAEIAAVKQHKDEWIKKGGRLSTAPRSFLHIL
jgi:hypothetical protein